MVPGMRSGALCVSDRMLATFRMILGRRPKGEGLLCASVLSSIFLDTDAWALTSNRVEFRLLNNPKLALSRNVWLIWLLSWNPIVVWLFGKLSGSHRCEPPRSAFLAGAGHRDPPWSSAALAAQGRGGEVLRDNCFKSLSAARRALRRQLGMASTSSVSSVRNQGELRILRMTGLPIGGGSGKSKALTV